MWRMIAIAVSGVLILMFGVIAANYKDLTNTVTELRACGATVTEQHTTILALQQTLAEERTASQGALTTIAARNKRIAELEERLRRVGRRYPVEKRVTPVFSRW